MYHMIMNENTKITTRNLNKQTRKRGAEGGLKKNTRLCIEKRTYEVNTSQITTDEKKLSHGACMHVLKFSLADGKSTWNAT
jgi:hypothetical protein